MDALALRVTPHPSNELLIGHHRPKDILFDDTSRIGIVYQYITRPYQDMCTHHNDENVRKGNVEAYRADIGYQQDTRPIAAAALELLKRGNPEPLRVSAVNRNDINVVVRQYL